jgi:phenylacetate-CoA ligase
MIIVKATNVYPTAVEALLHRVPELSEHYELHVDRDEANDLVVVKVEARGETRAEDYAAVGKKAEGVLRTAIGVGIGVQVQAPGTLPRYELKARRFFDHRPAAHRWQLSGRPS